MPYISKETRKDYDPLIRQIVYKLSSYDNEDAALGDLNYIIFAIVKRYLTLVGIKYKRLAKFIGTIECCKQEIYRRLAGPYEDTKIEENGDV